MCLPVTSRYFKSVTDFNLRFYWDKDSLQFDRVSNMHPRLYRIVQTGLFEEQQGYQELRINPKRDWQDTISIPDGEVLFEMCFTPLVEGPGEIPIHVRKHPYSTGDSLSFEIIGVPVDARANTGIINMLDEKDFYYEIVPLCTSSDAELYDFKLTITGNNGPYTYSFNDPEVRDSTFTDSIITVRDVPEGDYRFTVVNRYDKEVTNNLKVHPGINKGDFEITIDSSHIIQPDCADSLGGQVVLHVSPPDGTYSYHWIDGGKDYPDGVITGLPAGTHTFHVTDENQCANTITYDMKSNHALSVTWDEDLLKICPYQDFATVDLQVSAADYQVQIDDGDTLQKPVLLKLNVGDHKLSIWAARCRLDTNLTVEKAMSLMVSPPLPPEMRIRENDTIELDVDLSPSGSSAEWIFDEAVIGNQTVLMWTPDQSGYLHLRAQYPPGCHYQDSVFIDVVPKIDSVYDISLPNAFSPDGDGINDEFSIPISTSIHRVVQLDIFDR